MHILIMPSWYPTFEKPLFGIFFKEFAISLNKKVDRTGVMVHPEIKPLKQVLYSKGKFLYSKLYEDEGLKTMRAFTYNWIPWIPFGKIVRDLIVIKILFKRYVCENGMPDIIHAHSAVYSGFCALFLGRIYKIPVIITEHRSSYGRELLSFSEKIIAKITFSFSDVIVAVSNRLANDVNLLLKKNFQFEIIPNIVEPVFLNSPMNKDKTEIFTFISIGGLNKNKNHFLLIKAFCEEFNNIEPVQLMIGGYGKEYDNLQSLISDFESAERVKLIGALDRQSVVDELRKSDCLVSSSNYETFSIIIIEAMAMGLPIIATKCGGPEDIVTDETGILVDIDNVMQLRQALRRMYEEGCQFNRNKIREYARIKYSEEAVIGNYIDRYKALMGDF